MKPTSIVTLVMATLLAAGSAYWLRAGEGRKPYPKPTPPPPPSPVFTPSRERAPSVEEIAAWAGAREQVLVTEIESALATRDTLRRETVFTFLLPELLQVAPERVVDMVARQKPGEARDTLRNEVARLWVSRDRAAAVKWMKSLDEGERRTTVKTAIAAIATFDPERARAVADDFGEGRDGSREPAAAAR